MIPPLIDRRPGRLALGQTLGQTIGALAAFAEVAKKVQMDTVDLMLTAGKDLASDAQKAAEKATRDTQAAVKKAAAAATTATAATAM